MATNPGLPPAYLEREHKLCIAVDDDVWVMGYHNDLAVLLDFSEATNQQFINQSVIKIIFWLINDNWLLTMSKDKGQERSGLLAG